MFLEVKSCGFVFEKLAQALFALSENVPLYQFGLSGPHGASRGL
jgi:hypothetical protein